VTEPQGWLERYIAGECEAVWAEMTAVGVAVREPPYAEPAWATARETMRRAKANLELIVERLDRLGYQFWDGVQGPRRGPLRALDFGAVRLEAASTQDLLAAMFVHARGLQPGALTSVMVEQLHNVYRMTVWPWQDTSKLRHGIRHPADAAVTPLYERARKTPPDQVAATMLETLDALSRAAVFELHAAWAEREREKPPPAPPVVDHRKDKNVRSAPRKKDATTIGRLEKRGLALPLALKAWILEVGSVNLAGSHPDLCFWEGAGFPGVHADPLMIAVNVEEIAAWRAGEPEEDSLDVVVGWDARSKARLTVEDVELDFGYTVTLPSATADPPLAGLASPASFLGYLREAFRWGGFPGWATQDKRPDGLLAELAAGLAPL